MSVEAQRELTLEPDHPPERLDRVTARLWPDLSRSRLQALIRDGRVSVNGVVALDPNLKVGPGTQLVLVEPAAVAAEPQAEAIDLAVVYEDDDLVVIDKPAGLVVHPAAGHASGTLVNALIAHCGDSLSGIGGVKRPGIVHRLDKDTSGLLVVAKNDRAHKGLADQFADHGRTGPLERAYLAIVWGVPERQKGIVDAALARGVHNREKIVVVTGESGRFALTHYEVLEPLTRGETDCRPAAMRTRDWAHSSNSRAYGAYRPSAFGRSTLRIRFQDQSQPARRRGASGSPRFETAGASRDDPGLRTSANGRFPTV